VRPRISGRYRLKFKAQALPHKNHLGGYRMLYSHNCKFGVSQVHEDDRLAMPTLVRVFPALAALKRSNEDRVRLVNEGIVEELQLPLGKLDFGKGLVAKSNVALWRTRGDVFAAEREAALQPFQQSRDLHSRPVRSDPRFRARPRALEPTR
jgi:hypothetical protein